MRFLKVVAVKTVNFRKKLLEEVESFLSIYFRNRQFFLTANDAVVTDNNFYIFSDFYTSVSVFISNKV